MPDLFDRLRERLLRAGIRPAVVHRYVRELREHAEDAAEVYRAEGTPSAKAWETALERLGTIDRLAHPVESDPLLRSWASRRPFATFVLAPLGVVAFVMVLLIGGLVALAGSADGLPSWFAVAVRVASLVVDPVLPVLIGWTLVLVALRQRSGVRLPVLGIVSTSLLAAALHLAVALPSPAEGGEVMVGLAVPSLLKWALTMGLVAVPLLVLPDNLRERFALTGRAA